MFYRWGKLGGWINATNRDTENFIICAILEDIDINEYMKNNTL